MMPKTTAAPAHSAIWTTNSRTGARTTVRTSWAVAGRSDANQSRSR
jgi:hypothetical protein